MKTILLEKTKRIEKNKTKLEKVLKIKIFVKEKEVSIDGQAEDEYIAEKVLEAISLGFPLPSALTIKTEDYMFEIINIKDHTKRADLASIRARIIGKGGKTLKTLTDLTEWFLELSKNSVGIIGSPENIKPTQTALISLIKGSKQSNVYSYLEKHHPEPIYDLGLKEKK